MSKQSVVIKNELYTQPEQGNNKFNNKGEKIKGINYHDLEEVKKDLRKLEEGYFVSGSTDYESLIEYLVDVLESTNDENIKDLVENRLFFYRAEYNHSLSNFKYGAFVNNAIKNSLERNSDINEISREDVDKEYASYKDRELLEEFEDEALNLYKEALSDWQDNRFVDSTDVEILIADLEYRKAQRILDEVKKGKEGKIKKSSKKRKDALKTLSDKYSSIIGRISDPGKRAEAQMIWLIHKWTEKNNIDHIMPFYHGVPRDDNKNKIDLQLMYDGTIVNISLKSFSKNSNTEDHNNRLIEKEIEKLRGTNVNLVVVDSLDMRESFYGDNIRTQSKVVKDFDEQLPYNDIRGKAKAVKEILKTKKTEEVSPKTSLGKKDIKEIIQHKSGISNLLKLGYLDQEKSNDINAIMDAKKKLEIDLQDGEKGLEIAKQLN